MDLVSEVKPWWEDGDIPQEIPVQIRRAVNIMFGTKSPEYKRTICDRYSSIPVEYAEAAILKGHTFPTTAVDIIPVEYRELSRRRTYDWSRV